MDLQLEGAPDAMVQAARNNWRDFSFDAPEQALLEWTERLTKDPASCRPEHLEPLRATGFSDTAIHDAGQVIAYFNYINRLADGLGVDLEPEMMPKSDH